MKVVITRGWGEGTEGSRPIKIVALCLSWDEFGGLRDVW